MVGSANLVGICLLGATRDFQRIFEVTQADVVPARTSRETIYSLALAHIHRKALPDDARRKLNRFASEAFAVPQLGKDSRIHTSGKTQELLASIARDAILLLGSEAATRLRQCEGESCALLFLDTSRSGERRWCSMSGCGNKTSSSPSRCRTCMVFWTALTDMPPEKGTMAFLNGSHRFGVMGHYSTYGEGNLLDSYPELLDECDSSGNLTYSAGDVTVHSNLTVHSAGTNVTDDPRWTYIVIVNPADACWNGGPADAFQTDGLTLHKELDDERLSVIG